MLQFEGTESDVYNGRIEDLKEGITRAYACRMTGFRIYNSNGHFIREYALFDGKYRKVITEEERIKALWEAME